MTHPEGFEPTTITDTPTGQDPEHLAPSDFEHLADALPELKKITGISSEWVEWYEGFTYRVGIHLGVIEPPEPGGP